MERFPALGGGTLPDDDPRIYDVQCSTFSSSAVDDSPGCHRGWYGSVAGAGRCKEATTIVGFEDLPAGAVALGLLLVAVLLILCT